MPHHALRIAVTAAMLFALAPSASGGTLYVANNGVDPFGSCVPSFCVLGHPCSCGTKASPCRSISCAIARAAAGDTIVVGPGVYGDLNRNGILGEPGEETPAANCFCMLAVNKAVTIVSSTGAAATEIDARTVDVFNNVEITANGVHFGAPGRGFTVTETKAATTNCFGIDLSSAMGVDVRGNLVVSTHHCTGEGITAVGNNPGGGLVQGNQVVGWDVGINVGANTVSQNVVGSIPFLVENGW